MSKWSHLPNARHIDWIIQDVEPNPSDWWAARGDTARGAAQDTAYQAACDAARDAARGAAWDAAWGAAWDAARDAIQALIAYDHAGSLFDIPVEQVRVMAYLGQPAAILMLPACEVRDKRRELVSS